MLVVRNMLLLLLTCPMTLPFRTTSKFRNFGRLVLSCTEADFYKYIFV